MTFIIVILQIFESAFYKFESSPRFTNLSPVHVLQIWVQFAFYKSSPVRVLQHAQSQSSATSYPGYF